MAVDAVGVVLDEAEVERGQRRDCPATPIARRAEVGQRRRTWAAMPRRPRRIARSSAHSRRRGSCGRNAVRAAEHELGRAAADVHDQRACSIARPAATPRKVMRLVVPGEQLRREAVAPLDLAEERLAVLRVADGARARSRASARRRVPPARAESRRGSCAPARLREGGGDAGASTPSPRRVITSRRATSSTRLSCPRRRRAGEWSSSRGRRRRRASRREEACQAIDRLDLSDGAEEAREPGQSSVGGAQHHVAAATSSARAEPGGARGRSISRSATQTRRSSAAAQDGPAARLAAR